MINEFNNKQALQKYMKSITGYSYSFATSSITSPEEIHKTSNKLYYQLMPDGEDNGFFEWYCEKRITHQFFETREDCVIQFLKYWELWSKKHSS